MRLSITVSHRTAFGDRSMPFMLSLDAIWPVADEEDANIGWVRSF